MYQSCTYKSFCGVLECASTGNYHLAKSIVNFVYYSHTSPLQNEAFDETMSEMEQDLEDSPTAFNYVKQNWATVKEMWSLLGRRFYHSDHDTNNLVER